MAMATGADTHHASSIYLSILSCVNVLSVTEALIWRCTGLYNQIGQVVKLMVH